MSSSFLPNQLATMSADDAPQVHSVTCCVVWKPSSRSRLSVLAAAYQSKNL